MAFEADLAVFGPGTAGGTLNVVGTWQAPDHRVGDFRSPARSAANRWRCWCRRRSGFGTLNPDLHGRLALRRRARLENARHERGLSRRQWRRLLGLPGGRGGPVVATLIEAGGPAAIFFETLGERTVALAQLERRRDPSRGYEPMLERLLAPILADCARHRIPIIGDFGAANPPPLPR